jgi:D-arabinose 1-dehydrogenase-like Zn-dependent alcohol dehydrogenase
VGRLHYDGLALLGTAGDDLATAYAPIRTDLAAGGRLWVLGAGGPLGRMHVQRALEHADGPADIVATDRSGRAATTFGDSPPAALTFLAERDDPAALAKRLRAVTSGHGFDDIAVMAPSVRAIESAFEQLADGGVINLFAGLPRGTMCEWEVGAIAHRGVRVVGTSGSSVAHLRRVRDRIESGELHPNRSVSAVAGLDAAPDALHAVAEGRFAGKVVIFPNLRGPLPLTTLSDLSTTLPEVARRLDNGQWTPAAEQELLRALL